MLKALHMALALLTVTGFIMRVSWSYVWPDLLRSKWLRITPHVIDTLLLTLGIALAINLAGGMWQSWLIAKMAGLLCYIGFGVVALRGRGQMRHIGIVGALLSAAYIFAVAFSRDPMPF